MASLGTGNCDVQVMAASIPPAWIEGVSDEVTKMIKHFDAMHQSFQDIEIFALGQAKGIAEDPLMFIQAHNKIR